MAIEYRHVPYYADRTLAQDSELTEWIKDDKEQGLGVPARSFFIEVYDAQVGDAYAEVIIFDGTNENKPIPLYVGSSLNYDSSDDIYAEWIRFNAIGGWVKYRVHAVPGIWKEEEETGDK